VNGKEVLYLLRKEDRSVNSIYRWVQLNEGTVAGVHGHGIRQGFIIGIEHFTTVFKAEIYAIKACADKKTLL
jgi:hypothetical protein